MYLSGMIEMLSFLTDEELAWATDPREGVQTRCKFLPTPADVHEVIRERRARNEAANVSFRNPEPKGAYAYFKPDFDADKPLPQTERERRAAVVRQALGYNPAEKAREVAAKRTFERPSEEDIKNLRVTTVTKSDLTPQLRAALEAEGWPIVPRSTAPSEYPPTAESEAAA